LVDRKGSRRRQPRVSSEADGDHPLASSAGGNHATLGNYQQHQCCWRNACPSHRRQWPQWLKRTTSRAARARSAMAPTSDIDERDCDVCSGPTAEMRVGKESRLDISVDRDRNW